MNFIIVKQPNIIKHIQQKDIFKHNYNVNDLIKQFYKVSPEDLHKVKPSTKLLHDNKGHLGVRTN